MRPEPTAAEYYEAVIEVLRGMRVAADTAVAKTLWFLLGEPEGCDAEITSSSFTVRLGPTPRLFRYVMQVAPGVVSYLLDGEELPATRVLTRRIEPGVVPVLGELMPEWRFDARHVRIEALIGRAVIRIRSSAAELDQALPDTRPDEAKRFVTADRPCPHCGGRPDRFRVLGDGAHVCLLCGCSSSAP